jgi:hypothetical protein
MSDEVDIADEVAETILQAQIEKARRQQDTVQATGFCLFCDEPIEEPGRRWCSSECRDDWELEHKDDTV